MDQYRARRELINQNYSRPESTSHEISKTDTGLQRPVKSKKKGFGYQLGFSSKIYYSNNPSLHHPDSTKYRLAYGKTPLIIIFCLVLMI